MFYKYVYYDISTRQCLGSLIYTHNLAKTREQDLDESYMRSWRLKSLESLKFEYPEQSEQSLGSLGVKKPEQPEYFTI